MPGWHRRCRVIFMSTSFPTPRDPASDAEHPLARAFASFTEAAGSLERTYGQLQGQVAHLRQELEGTNRDLATSLEENHRIRRTLAPHSGRLAVRRAGNRSRCSDFNSQSRGGALAWRQLRIGRRVAGGALGRAGARAANRRRARITARFASLFAGHSFAVWSGSVLCDCFARPPRAFICGACSNPFSPKLWCSLRWKFLP